MATSRFERFLPWAGVLAGVCFAVGGYLPTGPSNADDPTRLQWITDHTGVGIANGVAAALLSVTVLFFSAAVRAALRSGEPGESSYSSVAFAGMVAFAAGSGFNGMLQLATVGAAADGHADAVTTLGYLGDFTWVPWVAASAAMFLAIGLGGLRTAALPRWLSIPTVVLGVLCLLGPTGVAVFLLSPMWFVVTGLVLRRRANYPLAVAFDGMGQEGVGLRASSSQT